MSEKTVTLDVREEIHQGHSPFPKVMKAAAALRPGERLLLIAPFCPSPLLDVLGEKGFVHQARPIDSGDWEVLLTRQPSAPARVSRTAQSNPVSPAIVEVDARGLEPPQPLVKILEAVSGLAAGAALYARTDRRPIHLYPHLEERGFKAQTQEQSDGSFLTHITRA